MAVDLEAELDAVSRKVRRAISGSPYIQPLAPAHLREAALLYPDSGGKHLRSAVLVWCCGALGGEPDAALPAAAAVELYHTWTLTHDDVIDRDDRRRGGPSVHAAFRERAAELGAGGDAAHYGLSIAILAGDVQHAWAIETLASLADGPVDPAVALGLARELEGPVLRAIAQGETRDLQFSHLPIEAVGDEDVLTMAAQKTGALYAFAAAAGGAVALGRPAAPRLEALREFGRLMGIAFQLRDDVLGIVGTDEELGKPVGSDIREGKRTTILRHAWMRASAAERATLARALGQPQAPPDEVAAAARLMVGLGGADHTMALASRHLQRATEHLDALPQGRYRSLLEALARHTVDRSH